MKKLNLFLLFLLLAHPFFAQTNVAVYVTGLNSDQKDTQKIIGNEIVAGIVNNTEYAATERTEDFLNSLKEEIGISQITNVDDHTLRELGGKFDATMVCVASVMPFQDAYYIQIRVLDVKTEKILATARETSSLTSLDEIVAVSEKLVDKLSKQLIAIKAKNDSIEQQVLLQQYLEQELKKQEEAENMRRQQEMLDAATNALAKGVNSIADAIIEGEKVANTYVLIINNTTRDPYRINLDGHILGVVNPYKVASIEISTDWYGRMQAVQTSGYILTPTIKEYKIPRQQRQSKITIKL